MFFCLAFAAYMCVSSFSPIAPTAPGVFNKDTDNFWLPDYGQTLVAAHRIGKSTAPENTLMAVETCLNDSYLPDILESDIQITSDGELVLFHDLYLDEKTDAAEHFGREHITVFSEKYSRLRELNMGEKFEVGGKSPYAGLRGEEIPDDLRILRLEDFIDYVEERMPGRFRYVLEVKYPFPWAPKMVNRLYGILSDRGMTDRVIVASFWPDVCLYIDTHYQGKLLRAADPIEVMDFYGCYKRKVDLKNEILPYVALQLPYYWKDERLIFANFGDAGFIDYAHKYGLSVQYWTISKETNMMLLTKIGADVIMTDRPKQAHNAVVNTILYPHPGDDTSGITETEQGK